MKAAGLALLCTTEAGGPWAVPWTRIGTAITSLPPVLPQASPASPAAGWAMAPPEGLVGAVQLTERGCVKNVCRVQHASEKVIGWSAAWRSELLLRYPAHGCRSLSGWLAVAAAAGSPSDWLIRWSCKSGLECPSWPLCLSKSMLGKSIAVQWERWAPRCCEAALTSVVCSLFESRWGCVRLRDPMRQLLVSERAPCLPELPRDDKYLWSDIQDDTAGWVKLEASPGWKSARTSQPQPCPATPGKGPCNLFALALDRSREVKILCWGTGGSRWLLVAGLWRSHCLGFCSGYLEPWY